MELASPVTSPVTSLAVSPDGVMIVSDSADNAKVGSCSSDGADPTADRSASIRMLHKLKDVVSSAALGKDSRSRVRLLVMHIVALTMMVMATGVAMHRFESPRGLARIREQSRELAGIESLYVNKMFTLELHRAVPGRRERIVPADDRRRPSVRRGSRGSQVLRLVRSVRF